MDRKDQLYEDDMDLLDLVRKDTGAEFGRAASTYGGEYTGPCPFCRDGEDRFHVWPEHPSGKARYWCRRCDRGGDAIQYLRDAHGMAFNEAKEAVEGITPYVGDSAHKPAPRQVPEVTPPGETWQARGRAFVAYAQDQLWGDAGQAALAYLRGERQLSDETIRKWSLGYNPQAWYQEPMAWGLESDRKVCMAPGIVIPCEITRALWYVQVRCPCEKDDGTWDLLAAYLGLVFKWKDRQEHSPKYMAIKGSTGQALFGADDLHGDRPLLLCEGEFDALLAWQEIGDLVDVAALGGATKGAALPGRWLLRMLPYERILVAFDADATGKRGAADILAQSKRARRIQVPSGSDLTDFYKQGGDLRAWLALQLAMLEG